MNQNNSKYLMPTATIDCENNIITDFVNKTTGHLDPEPARVAVALYYAVRDKIWYDPYSPFHLPEHYRASGILQKGRGYCVAKATLLCALARACGIPSRVGFATVINHLATQQLIEHIGSNRFVYHGFTELLLNGKWVKVSPAFNKELCERFEVPPLEFDGRKDAIFQAYNSQNKPFMEYAEYHGSYADIPVGKIVSAWRKAYGSTRVQKWIDAFEQTGGVSIRNFDREEVIKETGDRS
jgi:transglutaminase-like putative cysteine protease